MKIERTGRMSDGFAESLSGMEGRIAGAREKYELVVTVNGREYRDKSVRPYKYAILSKWSREHDEQYPYSEEAKQGYNRFFDQIEREVRAGVKDDWYGEERKKQVAAGREAYLAERQKADIERSSRTVEENEQKGRYRWHLSGWSLTFENANKTAEQMGSRSGVSGVKVVEVGSSVTLPE